jgi:hypothetical protein
LSLKGRNLVQGNFMKLGIMGKLFVKKMKQGKNRTIVELYLNNEMDLLAKYAFVNNAPMHSP